MKLKFISVSLLFLIFLYANLFASEGKKSTNFLDTSKVIQNHKRSNSPGLPDARLDYQPGKTPKLWSIALAKTIMARYPDYRKAYWKDWTYVQGYMLNGFYRLYKYTGDKIYLNYIKNYIDHFVDKDGNYLGDKLTSLDNICAGNIIVELYSFTHDKRYKIAAEKFLHAFDNFPRADGEFWHNESAPNMWAEGVFMGQIFLLRYGKFIGDSDYCYNEAAKQIIVFAKHALKDHSGLYLHGWSEQPEKTKWANLKTGLAPEVCSEGLGWYSLILVETLSALPKNNPNRPKVLRIYDGLANGLKRNQDPKTGDWFLIVDKGHKAGNWIDPSGSAMFTYSLKKGIELGLLNKKIFEPIVKKAFKGLTEHAKINDHGLVDIYGGSDGIPIKKNYDEYIKLKRSVNAKEAVGGFLWASVIMEKQKLKELGKNHE
jgi:unsaturated rhamnogalacturonyl hydrolase